MTSESTHIDLTPLQEGMVFHHLLEGRHSGVDIQQVVGRLGEVVDEDALVHAWQQAVNRHDALRTTVVWPESGSARGELHSWVHVRVHREDLSARPVREREDRIDRFLATDRRRGFALDRPPLMRLALFRTGAEEWVMVWTVHHMLVDGQSFALVLEEVFHIYEALRAGRDGARPEGPSYAAYTAWVRSRDPQSSKGFWTALLRGLRTPATGSTSEGPLPAAGSGGEIRLTRTRHLSPEVVRRLRALAEEEDATLNTLIQAAWALTLVRLTGTSDVTFGAIRKGRAGTVPDAERTVGLFVHTLPVRVNVADARKLRALVRTLRRIWVDMREHEFVPLGKIREWSDLPPGTPLFESVLNVQDPPWTAALKRRGRGWKHRSFHVRNRLPYPLMVRATAGEDLRVRIEYDPGRLRPAVVEGAVAHMVGLLDEFRWEPAAPTRALTRPLREERRELVHGAAGKNVRVPAGTTVHELILEQAAREPEADALVHGDETWSYADLAVRSADIVRGLLALGVHRGNRVGILMHRSPHMVAAMLGILRTGAAYVPIDPAFPRERIRLIAEDAGLAAIVAPPALEGLLRPSRAPVLDPHSAPPVASDGAAAVARPARPLDPAYVIYTSGTTGRPKGVVVEHRNVVSFFTAMDQRIRGARPGTWLAGTTISFDISVLELLWTLARGFRVALHPDAPGDEGPAASRTSPKRDSMRLGLFFFAAEAGTPPPPGPDRYRLLLDAAALADEGGLEAVWTPERHFHPFGGIYPNPSVPSAALAVTTRNVRIRAGSVVLPLHDPIRVAEEWAVVDNLSGGRVDLAFAPGWHDRDFVLAPKKYADRRQELVRRIDDVRALWRGDAIRRATPDGSEADIELHPGPVQPELPFFVTTGGSRDTFRLAGRLGGGVLTHLLGQEIDELASKIRVYREARKAAGHTGSGTVVLMIHTFVADTDAEARDRVRGPFRQYLRNSIELTARLAGTRGRNLREADLSPSDVEALLDHAFERYYETAAMMGPPGRCRRMIERLRDAGVDELACLVDFGVAVDAVLEGLHHLPDLQGPGRAGTTSGPPASTSASRPRTDPIGGIGRAIREHGVTHFQCTPSMLRLLLADDESRAALASLDVLLVGGEAFPAPLASQALAATRGTVLNLYGPTEATVWSACHRVRPDDLKGPTVPLGRPLANTGLYVLDENRTPVPVGVVGELWIGGRGVARGYHGRPELTRDRFAGGILPEVAGRLYRTGDLARRRADGVIEFVGRTDDQIKLRGHRIEPAEIEAALDRHPAVEQSVVTLREINGDPRLVAYIVGAGSPPGLETLRDWLARTLPDVMIPSEVVALDTVPLTPNGKVDRKELPDPRAPAVPSRTPPRAPSNRSRLEETIAGIWTEVLELPEVGREEDFFELGGHSLLTLRVHARIRDRLGIEVQLRDLFRFTTVGSLARHLAAAPRSAADDGALQDDAMARAQARLRARDTSGSAL